jgi:hypothetical protein
MEKPDARTAKEISSTVLSSFDKLTQTYLKMFRLCYDALAPGTPQSERNRVRHALDKYLAEKDGRTPPE